VLGQSVPPILSVPGVPVALGSEVEVLGEVGVHHPPLPRGQEKRVLDGPAGGSRARPRLLHDGLGLLARIGQPEGLPQQGEDHGDEDGPEPHQDPQNAQGPGSARPPAALRGGSLG